jgi:hypothetical protein
MCCFLTTLFLLGPRAAILVWWLINPLRFELAFSSFIWGFLGFLLLPWTTLMYLAVWSPVSGIYGFDWVILGLGLLVDIASHTGGGYGNRSRFAR